jgi:methionine sulfoxide reductase heme-binding subunit
MVEAAMRVIYSFKRLLTHIALALLTLAGCYLAFLYTRRGDLTYTLTIGFGYVCLVLLVVSLVIGPIKLLWQGRNPVNLYLRRDVGIWSGITGCLHVVAALLDHRGGRVLEYFFRFTADGGIMPLLNRSGIANYIGLAATILIVLLLMTSTDFSLRRLKGKRWKSLQRLNYALFALVVFHTLIYQQVSRREQLFVEATTILIIVVLVAQIVGIYLYQAHQSRRPTDRKSKLFAE